MNDDSEPIPKIEPPSPSARLPQADEGGRDRTLLKAIELALADQWDAAHRLVQQYDADRTAAWVHAVLHKIEGDLDNSRYWYRRAGKIECLAQPPQAELKIIRTELTG